MCSTFGGAKVVDGVACPSGFCVGGVCTSFGNTVPTQTNDITEGTNPDSTSALVLSLILFVVAILV